jgi:hypothetical protein
MFSTAGPIRIGVLRSSTFSLSMRHPRGLTRLFKHRS